MADITKKNLPVFCFLVMSMLLIFIYFCVMFFGDVQMSNMDITKTHSTEIYKGEQHGHHQKT
jgi:hypothetical protein